ncbi:helix-turn-helix domain-containing protein [Haloarchaeobius sp. HME9146]|uniref:helix-turn-helix domain-containing protein n=1 Tax=Haloarchaeobius sp. HME9146 TaxID=2978732 RepID=UPI0021BE8D2F|nr:helix-turn-helix domain-containing protein [Haloarchaeobius sp. HME9146]MCT9096249.1 helix-turn-helix domain-containing protein [Haloarchaeobius sp. HME9146]
MQLRVERFDATDEQCVRVLFWASGGDFDAFEAALAEDKTVATPSRSTEFEDGRLYQTELLGEGLRTSIYPTIVDVGGVVYEVSIEQETWRFSVGFPDHRAFEQFYEVCNRNGLTLDLHRRYEQRDIDDSSRFGLTVAQREVLEAALATGYLEIPRQSSLSELADHLGISENAASERFRRASKRLMESTIRPPVKN